MKLEKEELIKIIELNDRMRNISVLFMGGHDLSKSALNNLIDFWDTLGEKYNFNPKSVKGIDLKTGEVQL